MKAERLGMISAILASTCCTVPLGLALVGLGGLGLGSVIGAYHWYLTGGAVALLSLAWWYFLREKRRMEALASDIKNERTTRASLTFASVIVGFFVVLNVYAALGTSGSPGASQAVATDAADIITLPVRGMSCASCEWPIESNLKKIDGVLDADASAARGNVVVKAKTGGVSLDAVAAAIRAAGYEPDLAAVKHEG
jgi:mercuric ion transport protein